MKFGEISWIFINSHDFHAFRKIAAPQRWYAKRTVIPMLAVLIFLPGHSKISFSMQILVPNQNFGDFHGICWNSGAESDFMGFEGSLAGLGWKPSYSYRNIKVSGPPRTTRIAPEQRKSQNSHWNRSFPLQNRFLHLWTSENGPRTLRLLRVLGRGRQCRYLLAQVRFWSPKS